MSGDKGSLVVATLIGAGVIVYGLVTGSAGAIAVGILAVLVGGLVLKLLG